MSDQMQAETPAVTEPTPQDQQGAVNPDTQTSVDGAEPSPAQEEKIVFDDGQQKLVNGLIGDKVALQRGAERERDEAKAELEKLKASQPKAERPEIPNAPDPMDFDTDAQFADAVKDRDQKISSAAVFDRNRETDAQADENQQRQSQQQQYDNFVKKADVYQTRATDFGFKEKDLAQQGAAVSQALGPEIIDHILGDTSGPLITYYLGKNPLVLDSIRSMTVLNAAVFISTTVKTDAIAARKPTQAPDPATVLDGNGQPKAQRGPPGATFE